LTVKNSIMAFNGREGIYCASDVGVFTHEYNLYFANSSPIWANDSRFGTGEFTADPKFLLDGSYGLQPTSPAIDRGTNLDVELDGHGRIRIVGGRADIGAFEHGAPPPAYYVRMGGDNANSGRTPSTAWRTIEYAAAHVPHNSIVYVGAGTYRGATLFTVSGSAAEPTQFIADTTGEKTGDAGVVTIAAPAAGSRSWRFHNVRDIAIRGFHFEDASVASWYGVEVSASSGIQFDECTFEGITTAMNVSRSEVSLESCSFTNNRSYSLYSFESEVLVTNCEFRGNTRGPYSRTDVALHVENTTLAEHTNWAVQVFGSGVSAGTSARFVDCVLQDNRHGLRIQNMSEGGFKLENSPITGCTGWALGFYDCEIVLDATLSASWQLAENTNGILASNTQLKLQDYDVEGFINGYGLWVTGGSLAAASCRFANNRYGISTTNCDSFTAANCEFTGNSGYAMIVQCPMSLSGCSISDNQNGLLLKEATDSNLVMWNTPIADNTGYGVYVQKSTLDFNAATAGKWLLSGNGHGILGWQSDLTFDGFTVSGNQNTGVYSINGALTIRNSEFSNNRTGVISYGDTYFSAENSSFSENSQYGLYLTGPGRIADCQLHNNGHSGFYLRNVTDDQLEVISTTIQDNQHYGVYALDCSLTFDSTNIDHWAISGSRYLFLSYRSDVVFRDISLRGGEVAAFYAVYGTVLAENCTFGDSRYGVFSYVSDLTARNCTFTNNTQFGAYIRGKARFEGCQLTNNQLSGVYLYGCQPDEVAFIDTVITDNTHSGIRVVSSTLTFDATNFNPWGVSGNPTGLYVANCDLTINDITMSNATKYALEVYNGSLTLNGATVSDNVGGVYTNAHCIFNAADSVFADNTDWAITADGQTSLTNCSIQENQNGLWLKSIDDSLIAFSGTQIVNNMEMGLYVADSTLTIDDQLAAVCIIEGNGYGVTVERCTAAVTDFVLQNNVYGFLAYRSNVLIERATFLGNETGVFASLNTSFELNNCTISQNSTLGAHLYGNATVSDTVISENGEGVRLERVNNSHVSFANTEIRNNLGSGLFLDTCTWTLTAADESDLLLVGNVNGITAENGRLTLNGYSVRGNHGYGVAAYAARLNLQDVTLENNENGLLISKTLSTSLTNVTLQNNTNWGARLEVEAGVTPRITFTDSLLSGNDGGLALVGGNESSLRLVNTSIVDNTDAGLYLEASTVRLDDQPTYQWQIARNGTGISCLDSTLTLTDAQIVESGTYAVLAESSMVNINHCQLSGDMHGVVGSEDSRLEVFRSQLRGSGGTDSRGVSADGGEVHLQNALVTGYANGVRFEGMSSDVVRVYNTTIVAGDGDGIYQDGGESTVTNTLISGSGGRYGLAVAQGTMTHTHNLIDGFGTACHGTLQHATELVKKPRFLDAANGDYRLAVGSPAINAGADLAALFNTDLEGNLRPSFDVFEIGAFEYVDSNGSFRVLSWAEQR
jgi:hypothetical protein